MRYDRKALAFLIEISGDVGSHYYQQPKGLAKKHSISE
jgi:hypothetical protein